MAHYGRISQTQGFELPPEGWHKAALLSVTTTRIKIQGSEEERLAFAWELLDVADDDGDHFVVTDRIKDTIFRGTEDGKYSPSKFYKLVLGFTGIEDEKDMARFDVDDLINCEANILVVYRPSGGKTYANIDEIKPLTKVSFDAGGKATHAPTIATLDMDEEANRKLAESPVDITADDIPF
jgi:hypothetical protein